MTKTFFFYDLETSGLNPRFDRIMQFAGQRTDLDLKPVGEPINLLVRLSEDILPSPDAVMVTKITPQKTRIDGVSEAEFVKILLDEVFTPGTIAVGYNNVRFDDEFVRHALWRNFRDPYEWSWSDDRSRWDLLDVVRLVRALRPDDIKWPVDDNGKSTNRLELLAKANKLEHARAHDALSDVNALISLARLLKEKQPKMWDYLLKMRDKREVAKLVNVDEPQWFIYASGRYPTEFEKTTVALPLAPSRKPGAVMVYDLRVDPTDWSDKSLDELSRIANATWEERKSEKFMPLPVKELGLNRCPAIAPVGTLDEKAKKRLKLDMKKIKANLNYLEMNRGLVDKLVAAINSRPDFASNPDVEGQLYDSFIPDADRAKVRVVASANAEELADFHPTFVDERLPELLLRYKARNFPISLSEDEQERWENYRTDKFQREIPKFMESLTRLAGAPDADDFLLQELQLWAESIAPVEN
ncbi:MAG: exodeoxyribonuclease I [Candidatus Nomurabacteria bacterium]|jgi:exodeoxyribonuclease-1|nr:exodeoxyribonuclease I [Candidatus Nomurabacteria bacterium]